MEQTKQLVYVGIDDIRKDPHQPRKTFNQESLNGLAKSIIHSGLIKPIEVDTDMMIITGERRWKATRIAGLEEIPVVINSEKLSPSQRLSHQIEENVQQASSTSKDSESMNPIETARAYGRLLLMKIKKDAQPGCASEEKIMKMSDKEMVETYQNSQHRDIYGVVAKLAEEVGVKDETIRQLLDLLEQAESVQRAIEAGTPRTFVREALRAKDKNIREKILKKLGDRAYKKRSEVMRDVALSVSNPKLALEKIKSTRQEKEDVKTNRIVNLIVDLGLALSKQPFETLELMEKKRVQNHAEWIVGVIGQYLEGEEVIFGEEILK
jgi:ParB/RepB/Spo0J family partition protein